MSATTNTAAAMELRHVNPGTLVLIRNVRSDARPDPKLVASIKQHGLLQPITARDCADGLVVLYGHRRTLAAIEAGRETVPVLVLTHTDSDEAGRIITQLGENDHRDAVTDTDRATAYAQLALVGLTATQIARKTGRPVAEVKAGTTVAASAAAQDAMTSGSMSLEDAAVLAEFDDDPEALAELTEATRWTNNLAHTAQRIRDRRAEQTARAAAADELLATGQRVIDKPHYSDKQVKQLRDLVDGSGATITAEAHATCPGHVAWIDSRGYGAEQKFVPVYGCDSAKANGHQAAHGDRLTGGPMTEAEKAERREVIANNKQWDSAATVRGQWIETFRAGKTAPKDAEKFILAAAMLNGIESAPYGERNTLTAAEKTAQGALRGLVWRILTQWHHSTGRHTWREPRPIDTLCMQHMTRWGYTASDVEQLLLASK